MIRLPEEARIYGFRRTAFSHGVNAFPLPEKEKKVMIEYGMCNEWS